MQFFFHYELPKIGAWLQGGQHPRRHLRTDAGRRVLRHDQAQHARVSPARRIAQATRLCRLHHHNVRHTAMAATAVRRQPEALVAPNPIANAKETRQCMTHRTIQQLFDLKGKTALVTGGSRGLGLQLAHALGEAGARCCSARARRLTWKRPLPS